MTEKFCLCNDDQPDSFLPVTVSTDQECVKPDIQVQLLCADLFLIILAVLALLASQEVGGRSVCVALPSSKVALT